MDLENEVVSKGFRSGGMLLEAEVDLLVIDGENLVQNQLIGHFLLRKRLAWLKA